MIDVVYYEMVGRVEYFTVHPDMFYLFPGAAAPDCIESVILPDGVPFVLVQSLEILGIDDGVFSLGKRYPSEGVAVAGPAVQYFQGYEKPPQPVRNRYREGKVESNPTALDGYRELGN